MEPDVQHEPQTQTTPAPLEEKNSDKIFPQKASAARYGRKRVIPPIPHLCRQLASLPKPHKGVLADIGGP